MAVSLFKIPVRKIQAPHLKSGAAFKKVLGKELAGVSILTFAAIFFGGIPFVALTGIVLLSVLAGDFILQAAGFRISPRWDLSLFQQALILSLFFPAKGIPAGGIIFMALAFVLFYRLGGGRAGYVLQPVCLTLAFLNCFGAQPAWPLDQLPVLAAGLTFAAWFALRFPRTKPEAQRMLFVLVSAALLAVLHETNFISALVWSAAAGEIIFDMAFAPLSKNGRFAHQAVTFGLWSLLLAVTARGEALILTGLVMSFLAGWIENRTLIRKVYESAKPH